MSRKNKLLVFLFSLVFAFTLGFGIVKSAKAVEFDDDGVVEAGEVIDDDLFITGESVRIDGTVNGDVITGANTVTVNGTVKGSLVTGAQTIILNGTVEGSVYAGSSTMTLEEEASIGRNLLYGGFNLTTESGSMVERDLLVGAYQAQLSGEVGRDVKAGVGALELYGKVSGDVTAEVDSPDEDAAPPMPFYGGPPGVDTIVPVGIRVSEEAEIGGKLTYTSPAEQTDAIQVSPGDGVEFNLAEIPGDEVDVRPPSALALAGRWGIARLREFVTLLVLGALAIWQLPSLFNKVSDKVKTDPLPTTGWGLIVILVGYVGAFFIGGLILAAGIFFGIITLGGLAKIILGLGFSGLALALTAFGLLISYVSKLVVALAGGKFLFEKLAPQYAEHKAWPMVVGVLIYILLRSIPVLGWIVGVLVTLLGMGAIWLFYRPKKSPAPEVVAET